ncbi:hypothetical protein [Salinirussus salinus]|jgi:hypothetical protein|uniref:hypothetical protein n=1 Tax=Salinirussus salinus TaxID=1198300 RepID=UPI00135A8451|nr:hypothetical protein [Salinirussus salinus]
MGLRDRILDYVAKVFMPVPDHPARGGMTGEPAPDDEDDAAEDAEGSRGTGGTVGEETAGEGTDGTR